MTQSRSLLWGLDSQDVYLFDDDDEQEGGARYVQVPNVPEKELKLLKKNKDDLKAARASKTEASAAAFPQPATLLDSPFLYQDSVATGFSDSFTNDDDKEDALSCLRKAVSQFLEITSTTDPFRATELLDQFDGDVSEAVIEHFNRLELAANGDSPGKVESLQPAMIDPNGYPAVAQNLTFTGADRARAVEYTNGIRDKADAISEVQRNGKRLRNVSKKLKRDKDVVLPAVSNDGFALQYAARKLRGDPEIVLAALQNKGVQVLTHATKELRDNRLFLESLVGEYGAHGQLLEFASERLKAHKGFIKRLVSRDGFNLADMSASLRDNQEVVKAAIKKDWISLQFASADLLNNKEIVALAVGVDPFALRFASDELKSDRNLVLVAVLRGNFLVLSCAGPGLLDDEHFLKSLFDEHGVSGHAIRYASDRLKGDKELVISAVSKDGTSLKYVAEILKHDRDVVRAAVMQDWKASKYVSWIPKDDEDPYMSEADHKTLGWQRRCQWKLFNYVFRNNMQTATVYNVFRANAIEVEKELFKSAARHYPQLFEIASPIIKDDPECASAAVTGDVTMLKYASDSIKRSRDFGMEVVLGNGTALEYLSNELKNDKDVVLAAVKTSGEAIQYASTRLQQDKDVVLAALRQSRNFGMDIFLGNGTVLKYLSNELKNDKDVALAASARLKSKKKFVISAVSKEGITLKHANENLKNDKDVAAVMQVWIAFKHVLQIAAITGMALSYFANEFKDDKDVVLAAVKTSGEAIQYASARLQHDKDVVLAALRQNGNLLKSVRDIFFRFDRDCVLAAISSQPGALRFALGGLNQDQECLIKAGLWDAEHGRHRQKRKIVLSTRFSLAAESSPTATEFTVRLKQHPYFRNGMTKKHPLLPAFQVYSPNAFSKQTCDPNWTDMEWKCRGTKETCQMTDRSLCEGPPRSECCWRYSYRCHLTEAKASREFFRGFMIQVVEWDIDGLCHEMGKGQAIERVMAEQVGTKVFIVYEPCSKRRGAEGDFDEYVPSPFRDEDIERLAYYVEEWYSNWCEDMGHCHVLCNDNIHAAAKLDPFLGYEWD